MIEIIGFTGMALTVPLIVILMRQYLSRHASPRVFYASLGALFIAGGMIVLGGGLSPVTLALSAVAFIAGSALIYWRSIRSGQ